MEVGEVLYLFFKERPVGYTWLKVNHWSYVFNLIFMHWSSVFLISYAWHKCTIIPQLINQSHPQNARRSYSTCNEMVKTKPNISELTCLQKQADSFLFLLHLQGCPSGCFKYFSHSFFGFSWTLQVGIGIDLLCHGATLFRTHRLLLHLHQFSLGVLIIS